MSKNNHDKKKQNPPNYITNKPKDLMEIQKEEYMNNHNSNSNGNTKPIIIPKFRLGIDKNNNPLVTVDNVLHFMTQIQFEAFTKACMCTLKRLNPEIDYSELCK